MERVSIKIKWSSPAFYSKTAATLVSVKGFDICLTYVRGY